jgi:nitrite reductase/ring-hydroxylating ferredoxin subunit
MPEDVAVATLSELPEGAHKVVRAGRRELGLFNVGGKLYALPNLCPHQRGPLCEGRVSGTLDCTEETGWRFSWRHEGEIVTCPWHAQEFHIPTGTCIAFPQIRLKSFPVRIEGDAVLVTV